MAERELHWVWMCKNRWGHVDANDRLVPVGEPCPACGFDEPEPDTAQAFDPTPLTSEELAKVAKKPIYLWLNDGGSRMPDGGEDGDWGRALAAINELWRRNDG